MTMMRRRRNPPCRYSSNNDNALDKRIASKPFRMCKPFHMCLCCIAFAIMSYPILHASVRQVLLTATILDEDEEPLFVLSYSLYGNKPKYTNAMITTASQVPDAYPDWQVRIYHDEQVPRPTLSQLSNMPHVKLVNVPQDLDPWVYRTVNPRSWRFLVASDPAVTAFGIRDGDSKPYRREHAAVQEFLASGKSFHIMRDHPLHDPSRFAAILAGMWGGVGGAAVPNMEELLRDYYSSNATTADDSSFEYTEDQDFLWSQILPLAKEDCFQHDSFYCTDSGGIAFPVERGDGEFVGNAFNRGEHHEHYLLAPDAVEKEKNCLELRETTLLGMVGLPDTSYRGRTNASSSELWKGWKKDMANKRHAASASGGNGKATVRYETMEQKGSRNGKARIKYQTMKQEGSSKGNGKANGIAMTKKKVAAAAKKSSAAAAQRQILSYSLYGNNTKYTEGMVATAKEVVRTYPGWEVRVYHDEQVPAPIISSLAEMNHVELVNVPRTLPEWIAQTVNPMSWRFLVASDPTVQAFGIRDGDSRPSKREKLAVDEWLTSGKSFHIMRDHPMHDPSRFAAILGGMWGAVGGAVPNMEELMKKYYSSTRTFIYAEDQDFLWSQILPIAKNDCFQHDSYFCSNSGGIAFPMKREDARDPFIFVGNAFNRKPGIRQKDPRMELPVAVSMYEKCLALRETTMAKADGLPDTSYKGQTNVSSTDMWAAMKAKSARTHEHSPPAVKATGEWVLAYSLYGNNTKYTEGMVATATEVLRYFPGWEVRVYHDEQVPASIISSLAGMSHVKLVNVQKKLPGWIAKTANPMSWRFLVASDPTVKAFGIRDGDARPSKREKLAVDEWIKSGKSFHIMRDHPMHDPSRFAAILGGMWGAVGGAVPNMEDLMKQYYSSTRTFVYAEDQDFLWSQILPLAKDDCFQHDSYYCTDSGGIGFPMRREEARDPLNFVGNGFNRKPGYSQKDPRMFEEAAVSKYEGCLKLRETSMADGQLPDTSYKGRTNMSSTDMWADWSSKHKAKTAKKKEKKATKPNALVQVDGASAKRTVKANVATNVKQTAAQ